MTINIDEDLIAPIAVAIMAICFTIGYQTLVPKSQIEELILHEEQAFRDLSATSRELDVVTKELNTYKATAESLESLGASPDQAKMVIKAAGVYKLEGKLLGALIASESSFRNRRHDLSCVIGLCGINLGAGSVLPYDPYSDYGNILDSAKLLRDYKNIYKTDLKALARYKGYSALGFRQAENVMEIYRSIK